MTAVLQLEDVVKSYAGHPPVHALDGVSLTVNQGELVGIVGPPGQASPRFSTSSAPLTDPRRAP